ncbi:MAG: transcriptional repressor LexA [Holophagales bacterium]|nr:transcriptional repressor LexA [Holophagales bacterium]
MNTADLTRSQQKVLQFVEHFAQTEQRSPTLKEIADGVGSAAVSTIHKHVLHLIEKGFLERRHGRGNNIVLRARTENGARHGVPPQGGPSTHLSADSAVVSGFASSGTDGVDGSTKVFPFYGDVAAGAPLVPESYATPIELPHPIHRNKQDLFVLRVRGDSMMDDSILDGDLVVLQRRGEYRNGDRVVALIDGEEATLKELRRDGESIWLIPHNPSLAPRHYDIDRVEVQGVLVGVMRSC